MIEQIFNDSRTQVYDGGFSERVLDRILEITPKPSRVIYRAPTLIAAFSAAVIIVVITFTVGLGEMNNKYDRLASSIVSHTEELNYELGTEFDAGVDAGVDTELGTE